VEKSPFELQNVFLEAPRKECIFESVIPTKRSSDTRAGAPYLPQLADVGSSTSPLSLRLNFW
jgi:hypothetical protein